MKQGNFWCVGRNYAAHAEELGNKTQSEPIIFLKAGSSLVSKGQEIELPLWSSEIHHEVELAFLFDENLEFSKLAIAIDLTARDKQTELKSKGLPWSLAKSFKHSCPLSEWISLDDIKSINNLKFTLSVNNQLRQSGNSSNMLTPPETLRKYVLEHFPIEPGDVLLSGTPEGVNCVRPGDLLVAEITGEISAKWRVSKTK